MHLLDFQLAPVGRGAVGPPPGARVDTACVSVLWTQAAPRRTRSIQKPARCPRPLRQPDVRFATRLECVEVHGAQRPSIEAGDDPESREVNLQAVVLYTL